MTLSAFAETVVQNKYLRGDDASWEDVANRVASSIVGPHFPEEVEAVAEAISNLEFLPGGRYLANAGYSNMVNNCFLLKCEDSKESIGDTLRKLTVIGMTGGGVGINWSALRPRGARVASTGGVSTGPCAFMQAANEIGRGVVSGGSRRMAIIATLHWWHPDVFEFAAMKDWDERIVAAKAEDFSAYAPMDMTNISIGLDDDFFRALEDESFSMVKTWGEDSYVIDHAWAKRLYEVAVEKMLTTGEPGFTVDLGAEREEYLRNPCQPASATIIRRGDGVVTMGDITAGDQIWSRDGWVTVLKKWSTGVKEVWATTTSSGTLLSTANHRVEQRGVKVEVQDARAIDALAPPAAGIIELPHRLSTRTILDRELVGMEEVFDITVDGPSHTYWSAGHSISNCGEITSADDSDICCLGSINLAAIDDIERFREVVRLGTLFLLCGTIAGEVPLEETVVTRAKNRRLGLGLMGMYEWLVKRDYAYEENEELASWLAAWTESTPIAAGLADRLGVSRPVKTRALAPTGTIGIVAGTTTGIEPLFATAYKRRYIHESVWRYQYVIDATAKRLVENYGVDPLKLETAYDLAFDPERRLAFQAFVQGYTDHAISSTLNLPSAAEQPFTPAEFGEILLRYLPNLRGVTAYPDGARSGQPLNVVTWTEADGQEGIEFEEFGSEQACVSGVCGV